MMYPSEALQEQHLQKEARRLSNRAERDMQRVKRLQNAKRMISVDATALQQQINKKKELREIEKAIAAREAEDLAKVVCVRAAQEAEETATRHALARAVRNEWDLQAKGNKKKNKKSVDFSDLPPAECAKGALQKLDGEDEGYAARKKQMHSEMRGWVQEHRLLQQEREAAELQACSEENKRLHHALFLAEQQAKEDAALQAILTRQVQLDNATQIQQHNRAKREDKERCKAEEMAVLARIQADPMLCEVNECVNRETGRIIPDRFRGFSGVRRQELMEENKTLLHNKSLEKQQKRENAQEWHRRQAYWAKLLEQQEAEERQAREIMKLDVKAALHKQGKEQDARRARSKADAFGHIDAGQGLFGKFGTSLS